MILLQDWDWYGRTFIVQLAETIDQLAKFRFTCATTFQLAVAKFEFSCIYRLAINVTIDERSE